MVDFLFAIIEHFSLALTVETLLADIGRSRRFSKGVDQFERKFQVEGDVAPTIVGIRKIECFLLPHSEVRIILSSFVWIGYPRVTDRRTDGRNSRSYYSALHCKQCGRAVKIEANITFTQL